MTRRLRRWRAEESLLASKNRDGVACRRPLLAARLGRRSDLSAVRLAATRPCVRGRQRRRQPLDRRPTRIESTILQSRDVRLRHTGSLRQLRLRPTQLDPPLTDRIARMRQLGKLSPRSHGTIICAIPHRHNPCFNPEPAGSHFARNLLALVPKGHQDVVAAALRTVFVHPNRTEIAAAWDRTADMFATSGHSPREVVSVQTCRQQHAWGGT